ncbi:MAG: hypothetical protein HC857_04330, partial [Synechococcales cyanobacterium RU_4_20]|nr:hypothetical protein [Synechococcales cyanobacterium RU_4_20]
PPESYALELSEWERLCVEQSNPEQSNREVLRPEISGLVSMGPEPATWSPQAAVVALDPETSNPETSTTPQSEDLNPDPLNESPQVLPPETTEADPGGSGTEPGADSGSEPGAEKTELGDPELGILRLREQELSLRRPPIQVPVYLFLNASYLTNSNARASEEPVDDQLLRTTLSLTASPILTRRTTAFATVQGNLNRYGELSRLDYNELRFQAGVRHTLLPRLTGELGWINRQLYFQEDGDRFLGDNAVYAAFSRRDATPLGPKTSLTSSYRVQANFAEPKTSDRVVNSLSTTFSYDLSPKLATTFTGLIALTDYTQQNRQDFYGQASVGLTYTLARNTRLSLFGALTRGGSSDQRVDFDNALLGVSFSTNLKLF